MSRRRSDGQVPPKARSGAPTVRAAPRPRPCQSRGGHRGAQGPHTSYRPEETVLYQTVATYWPSFQEQAAEHGGLPKFVARELDEYLRCGILEYGCLAIACDRCGFERLVAWSRKRRAFCPSCLGRRMADTAAHLVEKVIPHVPTRQWVCSFPWGLRVLLGYDRSLCAEVLGAFAEEVSRSLRWRAKRLFGLESVEDAHTGAITFVQRFDSALRPVLASCYAAAGEGKVLLGDRAGQRTTRLVRPEDARADEPAAIIAGFNVHAKVAIPAGDRARLERLCRYLARPPLAQERLTALADGRLRYEMKRPWRDGTYAVVLEPLELMSRLAAMVPPPRFHMIPFHGVVSSHSSLRSRVVPEPPPESGVNIREVQLSLSFDEESAAPSRRPRAWLLRHVFQLDVTSCP
ncbi:MAG: transposase, partial [Polyangiaceae bacterium]